MSDAIDTVNCPSYTILKHDNEWPVLGENSLTWELVECTWWSLVIDAENNGCAWSIWWMEYYFWPSKWYQDWTWTSTLSLTSTQVWRTGKIEVTQVIKVKDELWNESTGSYTVEIQDVKPTITGKDLWEITWDVVIENVLVALDAKEWDDCGRVDLTILESFICSGWRAELSGNNLIIHPTQKPLALSDKLIKSCRPNGKFTVLIPFCGSGSECISTIKKSGHYIAFELNPDYVLLAQKNIELYKGNNLF